MTDVSFACKKLGFEALNTLRLHGGHANFSAKTSIEI